MTSSPSTRSLRARRLVAMLPLGFASGLPLALSGGTLQLWLADVDVDVATIGAFTLVGIPYTLKFLWAPLLDRFVPPGGRRRGWLVIWQALLALLLAAMAFTSPAINPATVGLLAVFLAFASASQDIVVDAYRTDVLPAPERGLGAALTVAGYRAAMIVSGGLAPMIAEAVGWRVAYLAMAALMLVGVLGAALGPRPPSVTPPRSVREAFVEPLRELMGRSSWVRPIAAVVLYKLGDAFAGTLTGAFLVKGLGFSVGTVGAVNKVAGLIASISGALLGGLLMARISLLRALVAFGLLQAVTNLGFAILAATGPSYTGMVVVIVVEQLAGGMGTAAFVALLMALCDHRVAAAQYALLSALAAIPRTFLGPAAGIMVAWAGWAPFFIATAVAALPGVWLVARLQLPKPSSAEPQVSG